MTARRMRHIVTTPQPARQRWQPATVSTPGWVAEALARRPVDVPPAVPMYWGNCRWKARRNQQIRERQEQERRS